MAVDESAGPARRASIPMRVALALLGGLVLLVSGVGVYLALGPETRERPAATLQPPKGFVFRAHPAPRALPNVGFKDGQGRGLTLAEFRGRVVLLNLWATWCSPCRKEMPALDRLQQRLGSPRFQVVPLSIERDGAAAVQSFYEETGVRTLGVYVDSSGQAASALGVVGIPTTLLIDAEGREIGRVTGPAEWDGPAALTVIRGYLARTPG